MPKELVNPSHVAKLPKHGHDTGHILKFSSNVGHMLPVYYDILQPGDKVRFSTEMFTQLTDIVSPAMVHLEEYVDWFFVPFTQLYQFAGDNLYAVDDSHTSYRPHISDPSVFPMVTESALFTLGSTLGSSVALYDVFEHFDGYPLLNAFGTPSTDPSNFDEYGVPIVFNAVRLLYHLGYGNAWKGRSQDLSQRGWDVFFLLAYQKIWYDCFRITDRNSNDVDAYNVDYLSGLVEQEIRQDSVRKWLQIHYRPWKRDFFTSMQVAPLIDVGDIGMQASTTSDSLAKVNAWLFRGQTQNNAYGGIQSPVKDLSVSGRLDTTYAHQSTHTMNTALLRSMFAVEKLMEITRRAQKRYDAQVLAHLGFKIPEGVSSQVYRLGSDKSILQINEVVATAAGTAGDSTTTLGEKGGRGAGYSQNKQKSFTAPCDGILMAIYSAAPLADYDDKPIDRFNTYGSRYDYWHPEFERLGMQPCFAYQAIGWDYQDSQYSLSPIGWQWRYMEYKMKFNRCLGAFVHNAPYNTWTVYRDVSPFYLNNSINSAFFYVGPTAIDSILLLHSQYAYATDEMNYESTIFGRDSLMHWFKFNVTKASAISNYSLPSL